MKFDDWLAAHPELLELEEEAQECLYEQYLETIGDYVYTEWSLNGGP